MDADEVVVAAADGVLTPVVEGAANPYTLNTATREDTRVAAADAAVREGRLVRCLAALNIAHGDGVPVDALVAALAHEEYELGRAELHWKKWTAGPGQLFERRRSEAADGFLRWADLARRRLCFVRTALRLLMQFDALALVRLGLSAVHSAELYHTNTWRRHADTRLLHAIDEPDALLQRVHVARRGAKTLPFTQDPLDASWVRLWPRHDGALASRPAAVCAHCREPLSALTADDGGEHPRAPWYLACGHTLCATCGGASRCGVCHRPVDIARVMRHVAVMVGLMERVACGETEAAPTPAGLLDFPDSAGVLPRCSLRDFRWLHCPLCDQPFGDTGDRVPLRFPGCRGTLCAGCHRTQRPARCPFCARPGATTGRPCVPVWDALATHAHALRPPDTADETAPCALTQADLCGLQPEAQCPACDQHLHHHRPAPARTALELRPVHAVPKGCVATELRVSMRAVRAGRVRLGPGGPLLELADWTEGRVVRVEDVVFRLRLHRPYLPCAIATAWDGQAARTTVLLTPQTFTPLVFSAPWAMDTPPVQLDALLVEQLLDMWWPPRHGAVHNLRPTVTFAFPGAGPNGTPWLLTFERVNRVQGPLSERQRSALYQTVARLPPPPHPIHGDRACAVCRLPVHHGTGRPHGADDSDDEEEDGGDGNPPVALQLPKCGCVVHMRCITAFAISHACAHCPDHPNALFAAPVGDAAKWNTISVSGRSDIGAAATPRRGRRYRCRL